MNFVFKIIFFFIEKKASLDLGQNHERSTDLEISTFHGNRKYVLH